MALLGRQLWRLINNKDTLRFKVLSLKYFPEGDPLKPKNVDRSSFAWNSLRTAASYLSDGFRCQVGNGREIRIKEDNWGFEGLGVHSIIRNHEEVQWNVVRDLWHLNEALWDRSKVLDTYGEVMGDRICDLPLLNEGQDDKRIWYHSHNGIYSTKTGYSWLILKKIGYGPHRCFWRIIWKLKLHPKVRIFLWRVGHNLLPTNVKIKNLKSDHNSSYPRCNSSDETLIHALRDCIKSKVVLMNGGFDDRLLNSDWQEGIDWLEEVTRSLDKKAFECLTMVVEYLEFVEQLGF